MASTVAVAVHPFDAGAENLLFVRFVEQFVVDPIASGIVVAGTVIAGFISEGPLENVVPFFAEFHVGHERMNEVIAVVGIGVIVFEVRRLEIHGIGSEGEVDPTADAETAFAELSLSINPKLIQLEIALTNVLQESRVSGPSVKSSVDVPVFLTVLVAVNASFGPNAEVPEGFLFVAHRRTGIAENALVARLTVARLDFRLKRGDGENGKQSKNQTFHQFFSRK